MGSTSVPIGVFPAPEGITPDFNATNGHLKTASIVVTATGLAISTGCLTMRVYTKAHLLHNFGVDDAFIISAWVLSAASQATLLYGFTHSLFGIHIWNFTISRLAQYQRVVFAASIIYIPALAFVKLALLMLYYRLLKTITKIWKYIIYAVAFVISSYSLCFVLAIIFGCSPLEKGWDPTITTGSCINVRAIYQASVITNTVSDVILILIPIFIVRHVRLPLVQRLGVIAMFGIGCLTIITSIIRLATIWTFLASQDSTYEIALVVLLVLIEGNFIIVCGSLPYLRYFLRHHGPRWIGESSSSRTGSSDLSPKATGKRRRPGLTQLQNDIERALTADLTESGSYPMETIEPLEPADPHNTHRVEGVSDGPYSNVKS